MSEDKHTPGPWIIGPPGNLGVDSVTGRRIALMDIDDGSSEKVDEARANARFITTTHELLEVAEIGLCYLKAYIETHKENMSGLHLMGTVTEKMRIESIIRKAKGEE